MKRRIFLLLLPLWLVLSSCSLFRAGEAPAGVELTILHLNDVYEVAPLEGGKAGGLARVATLKRDLQADNPNTIAVLAGDFLSPSLMANLKMDNGERIAGLQMVETLNTMGLDYATFGNHEFDLSDPDLLQKRIDQSHFRYTVCNTFRKTDQGDVPFTQKTDGADQPVPPYIIHEFPVAGGSPVRLAIVGVLLPFNRADYVSYTDVETTLLATVEQARRDADIVVALTHLTEDQDLDLAGKLKNVPLIMGGHDHHHMYYTVGNTRMAKADANAKTVYIHRLTYHPRTGKTEVRSELKPIDDSIADDPATAEVVTAWQQRLDQLMIGMGYRPSRVLTRVEEPLECTEVVVRSRQTNFGALTCDAFAARYPGADLYLVNSGSMRLDDNLYGQVTEYDILRTFPFGGKVVTMELPGTAVSRLLDVGIKQNATEGGYLQVKGVREKDGAWQLGGAPLVPEKTYRVVLPEFVASGRESNLGFLADYTFSGPESWEEAGRVVRNDIRDLVIDYLGNR